MAGINGSSMRDIPMPTTFSERYRKHGLIQALRGDTPQEAMIKKAYSQFSEGVPAQPGTIEGAGPLLEGYIPLEQGQVVGAAPARPAGDFMDLVTNLTKAGPEGQKLAESLMDNLGVGKQSGSRARPLQIKGEKNGVRGTFIKDPSTYEEVDFIPEGAAPIPESAAKRIIEQTGEYDQLIGIGDTFDPSYAGYKSNFLGDAAIEAKKRFGEGEESVKMVQWWQGYQSYVNNVRNRLFGAALTSTEKTEFLKAMVTPGMKPAQIEANLRRQKEIVRKAIARESKRFDNPRFMGIRDILGQHYEGVLNGGARKHSPEKKARSKKELQSKYGLEE